MYDHQILEGEFLYTIPPVYLRSTAKHQLFYAKSLLEAPHRLLRHPCCSRRVVSVGTLLSLSRFASQWCQDDDAAAAATTTGSWYISRMAFSR